MPLIDVMTVLIFFFLMSMKFDDVAQLGITPPSAESAAKTRAETRLVVAVNRDGTLFVNSEEIPAENLSARLGEIAAQQDIKSLVLIADEDVATKYTVFVVDQAQKNGLTVQLLTRNDYE